MGLPYGKNFMILSSTIFLLSTRLTNGQTDGRAIAYTRYSIMLSLVKKRCIWKNIPVNIICCRRQICQLQVRLHVNQEIVESKSFRLTSQNYDVKQRFWQIIILLICNTANTAAARTSFMHCIGPTHISLSGSIGAERDNNGSFE